MSIPKIFVSHSHKDSDWARRFAEALREQNVDVWFDGEISLGETWRDAMESALRESDVVVVLVSPSALDSPSVLFEMGAALGAGKKLIPIVSEDLELARIPSDVRLRRYLMQSSPDKTAEEVASAIRI